MNFIRKGLFFFGGLLIAANAFAQGGLNDASCGGDEFKPFIEGVEALIPIQKKQFENGTISQLAFRTTQAALLDLQVCAGKVTPKEYCGAQKTNLDNILKEKQAQFDNGMISENELDHTKYRVASFKHDCLLLTLRQ